MALSISLRNNSSQFYFAGSPIVATVNVLSGTFPSGSTIRRVHLVVNCSYNNTSYSFTFPRESDNGETFTEDISTAVRAALSKRVVSPGSELGPQVVTFSVSAYITYLQDGEEHKGQTTSGPSNLNAIPGAFTELELLIQGGNTITSPFPLYTKPEGYVFSLPCAGHDARFPKFSNGTVDAGIVNFSPEYNPRGWLIPLGPIQTTQLGKTYSYDMEKDFKAFFLTFLNRRGQLEDACAVPLESLSYNIEKKEYEQVGAPSETPIASLRSQRVTPRRTYSMSSGYCSQEMAEWWINEFLCSEHYWLLLNSRWIPCSVTPSNKKVVAYDRANPSALHVPFTVTLGLEG
jgi:hypothetical protein